MHKQKVIEILSNCFDTNKSVNYIVKQDNDRRQRVKSLIDYSFEVCLDTGGVLLTDDQSGVILYHNSDDKLPVLREAWLTLQFVFRVSGIAGIRKALKRETYITSFHPVDREYIYIWFIGIAAHLQSKGLGTTLINDLIEIADLQHKPIYLETSIKKNLSFYFKNGFELYHTAPEEIYGYQLYFLRRDKLKNND